MSKASEWSKKRMAQDTLNELRVAEIESEREVVHAGALDRFRLQIATPGKWTGWLCISCEHQNDFVSPEDAVKIGRWLIDTFGEDEKPAEIPAAPQVGDGWRLVTRPSVAPGTTACDLAKSIGGNEVAVVVTSANIQNKLFLVDPDCDPNSWLGRLPIAQVLGIWDTGGNK